MRYKFNWTEQSKLAYEEYLHGNYDHCKAIFRKAHRILSRTNKNDIRLGYACMMISYSLYRQRNFKTALPYFRNACRIYQKHNDKLSVENLHWLGYCFYNLKRWKEASDIFTQTIKAYQLFKYEDKHLLFYSLVGAGVAACHRAQHTRGAYYFKQAINSANDLSLLLASYRFLSNELISIIQSDYLQNRYSKSIIDLAIRSDELFKLKQAEVPHPDTQRIQHTDHYFGTVVSDPYRWLADSSSDKVKEWLKLQNCYSNEYLENIPGSKYIFQRASNLWGKNAPYPPFKRGIYYFFQRYENGHLQLCRVRKLNQKPKVVLDSNTLPLNFKITNTWTSRNGKWSAYSVSENGSDWETVYIHNLRTNKTCKETLKSLCWVRLIWKDDSSGFYYTTTSFNRTKLVKKIFFHKIGSSQNEDKHVYQSKNSSITFNMALTTDDKYLVLSGTNQNKMTYFVWLKPLKTNNAPLLKLVNNQKAPITFVGNTNNRLYFITFAKASLGRLVELKIDNKTSKKYGLKEIVPEQKFLLSDAYLYSNFLVASYATLERGILRRMNYKNEQLGETCLPKFTQITSSSITNNGDMFLTVQGYIFPRKTARYVAKTDKILSIRFSHHAFRASEYITEMQLVRTKYGIEIPMYLSYKRGLLRNGDTPTILTAYGGFGTYNSPWYSGENVAWMESGGLFAEAIIRGDLNLGWDWRMSGIRENKQNTFDDFLSAAKFLIKENFTCPARLGIKGTSHGGLVVACALAKRPDLFGAVAINSAPLNVLRHTQFGLSQNKIYEYGTIDKENEFQILYNYSPLHGLRSANYPATLILTGDNDDRVNSSQSYQFAATLQHYQKGNAPILLKVFPNQGHSNSSATTYTFGFLADHLGILTERLKTTKA